MGGSRDRDVGATITSALPQTIRPVLINLMRTCWCLDSNHARLDDPGIVAPLMGYLLDRWGVSPVLAVFAPLRPGGQFGFWLDSLIPMILRYRPGTP